jgi:hypothetical protein
LILVNPGRRQPVTTHLIVDESARSRGAVYVAVCGAGRNRGRGAQRKNPEFQNDVALFELKEDLCSRPRAKPIPEHATDICAASVHVAEAPFVKRLIPMR